MTLNKVSNKSRTPSIHRPYEGNMLIDIRVTDIISNNTDPSEICSDCN